MSRAKARKKPARFSSRSPSSTAPAPSYQARDGEGGRVWAKPLGDASDEEKANGYFERQIKYDPDLWIVEIEDREGRSFVDEPVI